MYGSGKGNEWVLLHKMDGYMDYMEYMGRSVPLRLVPGEGKREGYYKM